MISEQRTTVVELASLLAMPDPPDLRGRGYRVTQAGDPRRRQTVLLPLLVRWAQGRCLSVDPEPQLAPAVLVSERGRLIRFEERPHSAA